MNYLELIFLATGGVVCLFFGIFCITSIRESKNRAAILSGGMLVLFGSAWFGCYFFLAPIFLQCGMLVILLFVMLFFIRLGKHRYLRAGEITERVDERDTIFAREEYRPGTPKYEEYYSLRPQHKEIDDGIRRLPELLTPGGRYHDPIRLPYIRSLFEVIEHMTGAVDGPVAETCANVDAPEITGTIKEIVLQSGADDVGITRLNPVFVYSHVGRGPEAWGAPINNHHRYAIAFTLEMKYDRVEKAPLLPITEESALQYLKGAMISIGLASYIRKSGYSARAHIAGSNYQIMLPPVGHDAGLGELGRLGYLISPTIGARIRLGAVTTDLPLIPDKPVVFGVQNFCEKCVKCADNCPSGAIPEGGKITVRGVEKWQLNIEKCLRFWRKVGTDCGLCMKVCPYSHPRTFVHNLVRSGISRSSFARVLAIHADDLFYGKRVRF